MCKEKRLEFELLCLHKHLDKLKTKFMLCNLEKQIEEKLCFKFGLHELEKKIHCLERKAAMAHEEAEWHHEEDYSDLNKSGCNKNSCETKNENKSFLE